MTAAKVVILLLQASIFLTVFSLGLRATFQDAVWLLQRPRLLLRSLVAMNAIMPLFAAQSLLAAVFQLYPGWRLSCKPYRLRSSEELVNDPVLSSRRAANPDQAPRVYDCGCCL